MPAAGFRILNDSLTYQIDDTYRNFFIVGTGSSSTVTYTGARPGITVFYIELPTIQPIAFATTIAVAQGGVEAIVGGYRFGFYAYASVGTTIPYLLLGYAPAMAGNVGVAIWNAAGDLTYSSEGDPVRVEDQWQETVDPVTWNVPKSWSKTLASGRTYAILFNQPINYVHGYQGGVVQFMGSFVGVAANIVAVDQRLFLAGLVPGIVSKHWGSIKFNLLILDITGF